VREEASARRGVPAHPGAGTSLGAITNGLLIARWRILAAAVAIPWAGAIVLGLTTSAIDIG
jgi:hypothetical protein